MVGRSLHALVQDSKLSTSTLILKMELVNCPELYLLQMQNGTRPLVRNRKLIPWDKTFILFKEQTFWFVELEIQSIYDFQAPGLQNTFGGLNSAKASYHFILAMFKYCD